MMNETRANKAAFACWGARIAPVFDTARNIHIVQVDSGRITDEMQATLLQEFPVQKALRLVGLGIDTLICGGISRAMHTVVSSYGIRILPFVAGDLKDVIEAWIRGSLDPDVFAMPGCRGRGGWRFGQMHGSNQEVFAMNGKGRGMGAGGGRGQGQGGRGRGWRNMFYATGQPGWMRAGTYSAPYPAPDPEMETQALKNQAQILKSQLDAIEKRISEIKGGSAE